MEPTISVCICTRNRPGDLRRTLSSLAAGDELPDEVIVSDDGDGRDAHDVCREFPFVTYVRGPKRGLSANRNVAIAESSGEYVSFLDDDATVSADFVTTIRGIASDAPRDTVFTGRVLWNGVMHGPPGGRTFLGHFAAAPGERLENFHIACSNLFPRAAFDSARFDESVRFGYEEMDMADQLLSAGYRIEFRPELLNYHETPSMNEAELRAREVDSVRARFYVSIKHHLRRGRRVMVGVYAVVASIHEAAHRMKLRNGSPVLRAFTDMQWALGQAIGRSQVMRASVFWRRWLNKPHYLFRPRQAIRRLRRKGGEQHGLLEEIELPWGVPIRFRSGHSSASALTRAGVYDLCVTETLFRLAEPGELAVDVGANIGYMTSVLAARLGPSGRVIAVEPNPEVLALLSSNVARWTSEPRFAPITVTEAALSDASGYARLYAPAEYEESSLVGPPDDTRSATRMIDVPTHRLDDLVEDRIGVLKIDAEGAELRVMQGARNLLEKGWVRDVVFEEHRPYPTDVTQLFEALGFSVYAIEQDLLGPRVTRPSDNAAFSWDPPSYLATLDSNRALALLGRKGWAVFGVGGLAHPRSSDQRASSRTA